MRKVIFLVVLVICIAVVGCNESKQNLIFEEDLLSRAKDILNIDEYYYDTSCSKTRFHIGYMFTSHNSSKYMLFERPGAQDEGYFVLDSGAVICDQYGIDFKKYSNGRKVIVMFDNNSECTEVTLECRANKEKVAWFDIKAPQIIVIDLEEWGNNEKVDYISFRKDDNTIIREERVL